MDKVIINSEELHRDINKVISSLEDLTGKPSRILIIGALLDLRDKFPTKKEVNQNG